MDRDYIIQLKKLDKIFILRQFSLHKWDGQR